jgi:hypothetical protein
VDGTPAGDLHANLGVQFVIRTLPEEASQNSGERLLIGDPSDRALQVGTIAARLRELCAHVAEFMPI